MTTIHRRLPPSSARPWPSPSGRLTAVALCAAPRQARHHTRDLVRLAADHHARTGLAREALSRDLEGSPTLDADSMRDLLARLQADGLIHGDGTST